MTIFGKKFPFSRQKFLMTFFSHRPDFQEFSFLFPDFPYLCYVKCHICPFPHKKNTFFTMLILSHASDNTTSLNIGGTNAWAVPHLKFWGTVPSPPRSPPLHIIGLLGLAEVNTG